MTQKNIKKEVETLTAQISSNQDRLKHLREICKHVNKFEGIWIERPGSQYPAVICSDCGKPTEVIKIGNVLKSYTDEFNEGIAHLPQHGSKVNWTELNPEVKNLDFIRIKENIHPTI